MSRRDEMHMLKMLEILAGEAVKRLGSVREWLHDCDSHECLEVCDHCAARSECFFEEECEGECEKVLINWADKKAWEKRKR